jgi:hypothetical protein
VSQVVGIAKNLLGDPRLCGLVSTLEAAGSDDKADGSGQGGRRLGRRGRLAATDGYL